MAKTIIVHDKFRLNSLSLIPGGSTVTISYIDGTNRVYKNVKNPKAYINSIMKTKSIIEALINNQLYWHS